jgi:hypothetical protein
MPDFENTLMQVHRSTRFFAKLWLIVIFGTEAPAETMDYRLEAGLRQPIGAPVPSLPVYRGDILELRQ